MKKTNIEYYRIANGKYNEEGSLVILNGLAGYKLERLNTKDGFGKPIPVEKFVQALEKSASKPDNIKITKITNKKQDGSNSYKVAYKDKKEHEAMVIKIGKEVSKSNPELITRFDNMRAANITYRNTNNAKKVAKKAKGFSLMAAKVAGVAFVGTVMAWGFLKGLEREADYQAEKNRQYIEQYKITRQQEIDEKCSIEANYRYDDDCKARQEGYASAEEKYLIEHGMIEDENEVTRSRSK